MLERDVLSTCMFDIDNLLTAIDEGVEGGWFEGVEGEWCAREFEGVFEFLVEISQKKSWNKRNNIVALAEVFEKYPFALDYCENTPTWAHSVEDFTSAIDALRDKHAARTLQNTLHNAMVKLKDGGDATIIAEEVSGRATGVATLAEETRDTRQIATDAYTIAEKIVNRERIGLPFPWRSFQERTYGIEKKTVAPLAGRDGKGKSRLAIYIAHHWLSLGIPVLYLPYEDCAERCITYMAATHGGYDAFGMKRTMVKPGYMQKHEKALDEVSKLPLYINDTPARVSRIVTSIARHKRKYGIEAVVIDGFKDIIPEEGENSIAKDRHTFAALVRAAKEYDVAILPVMHLVKFDEDQWLYKSHIKGTGDISQSGRMVLMYQDSGFPSGITKRYDDLEGCMALDCQKASYGEEGVIVLRKELERGRFLEVERNDV